MYIGYWTIDPEYYSEKLDNNDTDFTFNSAILIAWGQWTNALNLTIPNTSSKNTAEIEVYGGTVAQLTDNDERWEYLYEDEYDNETGDTLYIYDYSYGYDSFTYGASEKLGCTFIKNYSCLISRNRTSAEYYKTAVHEFGHSLGWIGHGPSLPNVMAQGNSSIYVLSETDIDHLKQVYPYYP
jgi:predicted Zn-dependent protease